MDRHTSLATNGPVAARWAATEWWESQALLRFDLASDPIPEDATITSAYLELRIARVVCVRGGQPRVLG
jgi:hypothetical protein